MGNAPGVLSALGVSDEACIAVLQEEYDRIKRVLDDSHNLDKLGLQSETRTHIDAIVCSILTQAKHSYEIEGHLPIQMCSNPAIIASKYTHMSTEEQRQHDEAVCYAAMARERRLRSDSASSSSSSHNEVNGQRQKSVALMEQQQQHQHQQESPLSAQRRHGESIGGREDIQSVLHSAIEQAVANAAQDSTAEETNPYLKPPTFSHPLEELSLRLAGPWRRILTSSNTVSYVHVLTKAVELKRPPDFKEEVSNFHHRSYDVDWHISHHHDVIEESEADHGQRTAFI